MSPPPSLPYAPQRRKPLSLWNPLDYLILLYWVFYFPQALRWYVETFGSLAADTNGWQAVRQDTVQRRLALQGGCVSVVVPFVLAAALRWFGIEIDAKGVAGGVMLGVAFGVVGVADGVTFGVAYGVVGGVAFSGLGGMAYGVVGDVIFGATLGVAFGVAKGVVGGVASHVVLGWASGMVFGLASGLVFGGVFNSVISGVGGEAEGAAFNVVAFGVGSLRTDAALLALFPALLQPSQRLAIILQRSSAIPLVNLRQTLTQVLEENWLQGLRKSEGLLRYSLQFISVITALRQVLHHTLPHLLLPRIATWCSLPLYDWRVVFFQSASLHAEIRRAFWENFFIIPRRWRPQVQALRYDTPARAACAGFWHLHAGAPAAAVQAFAAVRQLPDGEELFANAQAIVAADACKLLADIAAWHPPALRAGELLRPQVQTMFRQLAEVAGDVALVQQSRSTRQRNSALNRASGTLSSLPARLHDCPTPERSLLEQIATQWLAIVLESASAVGTLDVREPVASPYIVGAPVPAERLAGRQDIFDHIAASWAKPGQRDSLVIFGHRRTGKSSIVRNLQHFCPFLDDTGLAVLNLQSVDWSQGLSDLCYAIAFELSRAALTPVEEPQSEAYQAYPVSALRQFLGHLHPSEKPCRYLLILDEYELLDAHLTAASAAAFVTALRGFTQQYPWLAMALVGLHTLQERSASFYQAIYTWRPIPVRLMGADAVADVLQVEDDDFPLEYSLEAVQCIYALTGGQPFLVQLVGDSLVQRFNRQLRQQLEPPSPTFSADDVDAVVHDAQFYEHGRVYFRGIWEQAGEAPVGQQVLLQALATYAEGLPQATLQHACGLDAATYTAALDALSRHDVVVCHEGRCRYSVELLRRWVAAGAQSYTPL